MSLVKLKTLKGTISSLFDLKLPTTCTVVICIYDCSNLDNNIQPTLVDKYEFFNPKTFPINYEIEYPYVLKSENDPGLYHMSVRIYEQDKIIYSNNCRDVIARNQKARNYLDVYLYYLPYYNVPKQDQETIRDSLKYVN